MVNRRLEYVNLSGVNLSGFWIRKVKLFNVTDLKNF